MKILITGGSGFIGTTAVERFCLDKNYEIASLDLVPPKETFDGVEYFQTDLITGDIPGLGRPGGTPLWSVLSAFPPDAIVHLCAQARVDPSVKDPFGTYDTNVLATLTLAKHVSRQNPPPLFVYISSEAIYGQADSYPTKENDHFRPISPYAASKIASDVMVQQLNGRLGMKTCVLRSGMGMGPRSDPKAQVVSRFIANALEGKPLRFPSGPVVHPTRDINPVWNFVNGVRLVLEAKATGVYNIASGREMSIFDCATKVCGAVGRDFITFDPSFRYREGEEGMRTWLDIEKAREDLGYEPKISFEDALPPTIEWMKKWKDAYWK